MIQKITIFATKMAYPEASMSWERAEEEEEEAIKRNREKEKKERQEIKRLLSITEDKHIIMAVGGCGQITNHAYSVYFNHVPLRIL